MIRQLKYALALLLTMLVASPACAIVPTQPYPIVPNTPARANEVQADFAALYNALNGNLDATNFSTTGSGIYASQIKPTTTVQGTFGGTTTYSFVAANATTTPLKIVGASTQTAPLLSLQSNGSSTDIFNVQPNGTTNASMFHAGTNGAATVAGALSYGVDQGGYTAAIIASNDGGGNRGVTSDMFGVYGNNGTNLLALDHTGSFSVVNRSVALGFNAAADIVAGTDIVAVRDLKAGNNVVFGTVSSGGTLSGATGNINATGALTMASAVFSGNVQSGSVNTGAFSAGGIATFNNATTFNNTATFNAALTNNSTTSLAGALTTSSTMKATGAVSGQFLPVVNINGFTSYGAKASVFAGSTLTDGTGNSASPVALNFDAAPVCTVTLAGGATSATTPVVNATATSLSVSGNTFRLYNFICFGT